MEFPVHFADLQDHIVELIFSKLPFYTLSTCRIVCKSWNDLVLDRASTFKSLPNAFLINTFDVFCSSFRTSQFHCIDYDTAIDYVASSYGVRSSLPHISIFNSINYVASSYNVRSSLPHISIVNSCNGLLYVSSSDEYQHNCTSVANYGILNPMTNEFLYLFELDRFMYKFGFGFSPKTKQYKLFRISYDYLRGISIIQLIRFGIIPEFNNNPKPLQPFPFRINGHGAYLNGVIYWIGNNIANEFVIYGLDVETEIFETIAILDVDGPWFDRYHAKLQLFNDTIYAIIQMPLPTSSKIEVWSMRDKHSWIKEFVHMWDDVTKYPNFHLVKDFEDRISFLINNDLFCFHKTERKITTINTLFNPWDKRIVNVLHMQSFQFGYVRNILEGKDPFTSNE